MPIHSIPPEKLAALDKTEALFTLAHVLMTRLMHIEPGALQIDEEDGSGSLFTTTEEGKFIAEMLDFISDMAVMCQCDECVTRRKGH